MLVIWLLIASKALTVLVLHTISPIKSLPRSVAVKTSAECPKYRIRPNFRGAQFSQIALSKHFAKQFSRIKAFEYRVF